MQPGAPTRDGRITSVEPVGHIEGALVHRYPYALADVDALGAGRAYLNGLGVLVLFFALAAVTWAVDGRVPSLRTNERTVALL